MNEPDALRYDFEVTAHSTYARAGRLLAAHAAPGLVLDLGCGTAALAGAVAAHGFGYLGIDVDAAGLGAARRRGIECVEADLSFLTSWTAPDAVPAAVGSIRAAVGDRPVSAVAMLDVVEHLADPDRVLAGVTRLIEEVGGPAHVERAPLLVVSIPNVAHVELGAKLITGRWDVTEVGLLDSTHVTLFTEARLDDVMTRAGFVELDRDDNVHDRTEQDFPSDHPALARSTVLSQFLRSLRRRSGPGDETYQFVRCYRRATDAERHERVRALAQRPTGRPDDPAARHREPFCTVVVRTEGARASLTDALTSLAAQTDVDIEVLVMAHHPDPEVVRRVEELVAQFEPGFADRVEVVHVTDGGRSRPLNEAVTRARGRYLALLDDDDVVTADWIETFRRAAESSPGTVVRAPCVLQWTEPVAESLAEVTTVSGYEAAYPRRFDFLDHVWRNRSPSCSYAVPTEAVRSLGVRFDETLEVCEDWKFLMDVAAHCGVTDADTATATSVYRRRRQGDSIDLAGEQRWLRDHLEVARSLAARPSLVPAGALAKARSLYEALEEAARRDAAHLEELTALRNRVEALERSRAWRLSAPLRRLASLRSAWTSRRAISADPAE